MRKLIFIPKSDQMIKTIEELESVKNKIDAVLKIKANTLEEEILLKYIEVQQASIVADYLNDKGYRIKSDEKDGERKYTSNDITDVIKSQSKYVNANVEIHNLARAIFEYYKRKGSWNNIVKACKEIEITEMIF